MNCPYCNKDIFGWTGLQELQKFQKHLPKCKKNPANCLSVNLDGELERLQHNPDMKEALEIRAKSGQ